ncbi:hypothetical protein [Labedaea rhizosphaerae]|uniref:DUF4177 domain-containing protein n=1 Tax=Labedaea rhizosphaerae TaxID=598644 RepID=A0A4R6S4V7_LABRH|nr:hypothetical protein [Labedaea rhizosphaerae]TDP94799.1 hypothetical protein EV186_10531 [Labedaea rhizosphaerae]
MTYKIVTVRATGLTPEAVSEELERELNTAVADGWDLDRIQPIIYNSSTTGYLLLILRKDAA